MSQEDLDLLAAEYVLGTLDAEARGKVAADLERDGELRERVDSWAQRLDQLEDRSAAITPSADLWSRIDAALDAETQVTEPFTLRAEDGPWQPIARGIDKKLLFQDPVAGVESFMLRLAPGAVVPSHGHEITEECILLEGDVTIGDIELRPGDFHAMPAGVDHPDITTRNGALFYVRGEIRAA